MALKATSKFRLSTWLKQNFLQMEHYFSSNGFFFDKDNTLKIISITLYNP